MTSTTIVTIDLMLHDRALLERRLDAGPSAEKQSSQRNILRAGALAFAALLVIPGVEFRLSDSGLDFVNMAAGNVLIMLCFAIIWRVYRENTFTSATVQVEDTQQLVSSGPYAIVRHPMYLGAVCGLVGTPLALTSKWAVAPAAALVLLIVWRIRDEERILVAQLPGYMEYMRRVRYRLTPVTSRRNPATRSRHIPASRRGAEERARSTF